MAAVYCVCRLPYDVTRFMIECDVCKDWFHGSCVGVEEHQAVDIDLYHCPNCAKTHGSSLMKKRKNWHRHDYTEGGATGKPVQTGTPVFVKKLQGRSFPSAEEVVRRMPGSQLTADYIIENGFSSPIIVSKKDGLGMTVPPASFTVSDVERYVGSDRMIDVIDVNRQADFKVTMKEFCEYYNSTSRQKVLNIISLEFSDTRLSELVKAPELVHKLSWVENYWPEDAVFPRPYVQKYCLMGVRDSYTDFHIDFGGTSVWYHLLKGEKIFYLIKPSTTNLARYERWSSSPTQSEVFFGDLVDKCYKCVLKQGQTLFLPTGWIHAVLTPYDCIAFGGNFLHSLNVEMQIRAYNIETRLKTPEVFKFPNFESMCWYAGKSLLEMLKEMREDGDCPRTHVMQGARSLLDAFRSWTQKENVEQHEREIPDNLRPGQLIKELGKELQLGEQVKVTRKPCRQLAGAGEGRRVALSRTAAGGRRDRERERCGGTGGRRKAKKKTTKDKAKVIPNLDILELHTKETLRKMVIPKKEKDDVPSSLLRVVWSRPGELAMIEPELRTPEARLSFVLANGNANSGCEGRLPCKRKCVPDKAPTRVPGPGSPATGPGGGTGGKDAYAYDSDEGATRSGGDGGVSPAHRAKRSDAEPADGAAPGAAVKTEGSDGPRVPSPAGSPHHPAASSGAPSRDPDGGRDERSKGRLCVVVVKKERDASPETEELTPALAKPRGEVKARVQECPQGSFRIKIEAAEKSKGKECSRPIFSIKKEGCGRRSGSGDQRGREPPQQGPLRIKIERRDRSDGVAEPVLKECPRVSEGKANGASGCGSREKDAGLRGEKDRCKTVDRDARGEGVRVKLKITEHTPRPGLEREDCPSRGHVQPKKEGGGGDGSSPMARESSGSRQKADGETRPQGPGHADEKAKHKAEHGAKPAERRVAAPSGGERTHSKEHRQQLTVEGKAGQDGEKSPCKEARKDPNALKQHQPKETAATHVRTDGGQCRTGEKRLHQSVDGSVEGARAEPKTGTESKQKVSSPREQPQPGGEPGAKGGGDRGDVHTNGLSVFKQKSAENGVKIDARPQQPLQLGQQQQQHHRQHKRPQQQQPEEQQQRHPAQQQQQQYKHLHQQQQHHHHHQQQQHHHHHQQQHHQQQHKHLQEQQQPKHAREQQQHQQHPQQQQPPPHQPHRQLPQQQQPRQPSTHPALWLDIRKEEKPVDKCHSAMVDGAGAVDKRHVQEHWRGPPWLETQVRDKQQQHHQQQQQRFHQPQLHQQQQQLLHHQQQQLVHQQRLHHQQQQQLLHHHQQQLLHHQQQQQHPYQHQQPNKQHQQTANACLPDAATARSRQRSGEEHLTKWMPGAERENPVFGGGGGGGGACLGDSLLEQLRAVCQQVGDVTRSGQQAPARSAERRPSEQTGAACSVIRATPTSPNVDALQGMLAMVNMPMGPHGHAPGGPLSPPPLAPGRLATALPSASHPLHGGARIASPTQRHAGPAAPPCPGRPVASRPQGRRPASPPPPTAPRAISPPLTPGGHASSRPSTPAGHVPSPPGSPGEHAASRPPTPGAREASRPPTPGGQEVSPPPTPGRQAASSPPPSPVPPLSTGTSVIARPPPGWDGGTAQQHQQRQPQHQQHQQPQRQHQQHQHQQQYLQQQNQQQYQQQQQHVSQASPWLPARANTRDDAYDGRLHPRAAPYCGADGRVSTGVVTQTSVIDSRTAPWCPPHEQRVGPLPPESGGYSYADARYATADCLGGASYAPSPAGGGPASRPVDNRPQAHHRQNSVATASRTVIFEAPAVSRPHNGHVVRAGGTVPPYADRSPPGFYGPYGGDGAAAERHPAPERCAAARPPTLGPCRAQLPVPGGHPLAAYHGAGAGPVPSYRPPPPPRAGAPRQATSGHPSVSFEGHAPGRVLVPPPPSTLYDSRLAARPPVSTAPAAAEEKVPSPPLLLRGLFDVGEKTRMKHSQSVESTYMFSSSDSEEDEPKLMISETLSREDTWMTRDELELEPPRRDWSLQAGLRTAEAEARLTQELPLSPPVKRLRLWDPERAPTEGPGGACRPGGADRAQSPDCAEDDSDSSSAGGGGGVDGRTALLPGRDSPTDRGFKRPKKGMATAKQRLGKILKLQKNGRMLL